jgi:hypothetical protein
MLPGPTLNFFSATKIHDTSNQIILWPSLQAEYHAELQAFQCVVTVVLVAGGIIFQC